MNYLILIPSSFELSFINVNNSFLNINTINSGIGFKTTKTVEKYISSNKDKYLSVILIGFAGGINVKTKQIFSINETFNEKGENIKLSTFNNTYQNENILTLRKPIHSIERKKSFLNISKLIDMETFYLAKFCKDNDVNLYSYRIVLDDCTKNLKQVFLGNEKPSKEILDIGERLNLLYNEIVNLIK